MSKQTIEEARKDYNGWQGAAAIVYDLEDDTIWTDVFASDNENISYHSDSIVVIEYKDNVLHRNNKIGKERLNARIAALKDTFTLYKSLDHDPYGDWLSYHLWTKEDY